MKTHEELSALLAVLPEGGWERLNGNTWSRKARHGRWELTTSYVMHEATLTLGRRGDLRGELTPNRSYRGAHPLSWAGNIPGIRSGAISRKALDKP